MPAEQVTPIDDDSWEDTVEHTSSGVKDILVTGKVCKVPSSLQFHRPSKQGLTRIYCRQVNGKAKHGDTSLF